MTSTVERRPAVPRKAPARKPARKPASGRKRPSVDWSSTLRPGAIAAGWALGAGLVAIALPVLLIWAADGRSGADSVEATRTAAQLWLLAHGTSLSVPGGVVGLTPLGLTLLPLALLHRAGRHSVRLLSVSSLGQAGALIAAIAVPYGLVATCLTAVVGTGTVTPDPVRAVIGCFVVSVVGSALGVLRESGLRPGLPDSARRVVRSGSAAVGVLLVAGVLLFALSLLTHASRVSSLSGATGPGIVGGTGLVVLQLLLIPNAAIWGAAWLSGPGFAVGVGTHVSPWSTSLGQVPALPVLAGLPVETPSSSIAVLSLVVPLVAGVVAGCLLAGRTDGSLRRAAVEGVLVGPVAGLVMAALAFVSGGPLGGGRLATVGPSAWQVGVAVAVQVGVWCAMTTALLRWRRT